MFFLLRVTTSTSRPFPETTPCVRSRQVRGSAVGCFLRQYTVTTSPRPRTQSHPAVTLVCRTPCAGIASHTSWTSGVSVIGPRAAQRGQTSLNAGSLILPQTS